MKFLRSLVFALAAFGAVLATAPAANAFQNVLCAPNTVDQANAHRMVNPNTNNAYVLNGQGCAVIAQADIGWFLSQGYSAGPPFGPNILFNTGVQTGTTSVQVGLLPPGAYIQHIIVNNLTANAITGGLTFGTAAAGTQIASVALACAANCLVFEPDASIAGRVFSTTASTPIFTQAVTAWNNANANITIVYGYF